MSKIKVKNPVGRDCRAFYADTIFGDRVRRIDRDFVVGMIADFDGQIIIVKIDIKVRQDEPVANPLPDDPGHLISVDLDDGIFHLDLGHVR